jgi:trk system potassium uptake protein TrkA
MRIALVGADPVVVATARLLLERGHEVVIIERDRARIDELSDDLDCAFLHGDGSKPHILSEVDPGHTDFLFCMTDNDQDNILASLVGRSLGFQQVVTSIRDPDYRKICVELGLENVIVPSRTISRYLADKVAGIDVLELSTMLRGDARFFECQLDERHAGSLQDLELPPRTRVVFFYRDDELHLVDEDTTVEAGDEVVFITRSQHLQTLHDRYQQKQTEED